MRAVQGPKNCRVWLPCTIGAHPWEPSYINFKPRPPTRTWQRRRPASVALRPDCHRTSGAPPATGTWPWASHPTRPSGAKEQEKGGTCSRTCVESYKFCSCRGALAPHNLADPPPACADTCLLLVTPANGGCLTRGRAGTRVCWAYQTNGGPKPRYRQRPCYTCFFLRLLPTQQNPSRVTPSLLLRLRRGSTRGCRTPQGPPSAQPPPARGRPPHLPLPGLRSACPLACCAAAGRG
jgi:hypothetical protein